MDLAALWHVTFSDQIAPMFPALGRILNHWTRNVVSFCSLLSFEVQIVGEGNLVKVYFNNKKSIKPTIFNPIYVKLNDLIGAKLNFICSDKAQ